MNISVLPLGDPGVFRSMLLPETADALAAGEPVTALALMLDDMAIGAIAGYLEDQRFHISSLYIAPDYRRCGGGRLLLTELFRLLDGQAAGMEFRFTATQEDHKTLPPFLDVMGFDKTPDKGEALYLTTIGTAATSPFFARDGKQTGTPFSELSSGALSLMNKAAMLANAPLPVGGLRAETVDRELSIAHLSGSQMPMLCLIPHGPAV